MSSTVGLPTTPTAPAAPTLDANGAAQMSGSTTAQAGVATGTAEVGQVQSARGEVDGAIGDPSGTAKSAATARATDVASASAPVDPSQARSNVEGAVGAYEDPKAAAKGQVDTALSEGEQQGQGVAEGKVTGQVGVSTNVTVATPPKPDGTK